MFVMRTHIVCVYVLLACDVGGVRRCLLGVGEACTYVCGLCSDMLTV